MKISYLILAHHNPAHLEKLVQSLSSEHCDFFIHIDKKSDIKDFAHIKRDNIFFCENRVRVYWGEFSIVQATINLLRQSLRDSCESDYKVLLSGSDYPLHNHSYIHKFFQENRGAEFMDIEKFPTDRKLAFRINTYFFQTKVNLRFILKIRKLLRGMFYRRKWYGIIKRNPDKYLQAKQAYCGTQWWALTHDACKHIIHFIDSNKNFVRFFKNTLISDEMFFHTILGNSIFKEKIRRGLMYTDWSDSKAHPAWIGPNHIKLFEANANLMASDHFGEVELLFARKFPEKSDDQVEKMNRIIELKGSG